MTIILGIDPGTAITGYGVIEQTPNGLSTLDFGCIRTPAKLTLPKRYQIIFEAIEALITKYSPDALAIETQFVYKNAQSALKIGMARAMALLAAARKDIPVHEYAPSKIKIAVTGNGNSGKEAVQKMMQLHLKLPSLPTPEDAADALAIAMCHIQNNKGAHVLRLS
ncbi:MAG: crossover junction endodeoxyribonuclease RuvC [Simkaniaceae bacterium]|nr:crossover junction endodeoxyribonuclease RuvC [Simkaniaceae bacterium]